MLQSLGQPHFVYGLTHHTEAARLSAEGLDHPSREIHIHRLLLLQRPPRLGEIQRGGYILATVETGVKRRSLPTMPRLPPATAAQRSVVFPRFDA